MKILFLSTWFPYPPDNGSKIRVYHLLRALSEKHRVTLASFAFETAQPDNADVLHHFCEAVLVVRRSPFARNGIANALRFFSPAPIVTRPLPEMSRAIQNILDQNNFDVAIASTEVMATYALSTSPATTKVLEEHNCLSRWMWERYREHVAPVQRLRCWISWQKTRYYEAQLFRKFDLCTMVSEQDYDASLQMLPGYKGQVEVIPNGVNCQHNQPGMASKQPNTLIYNGALTYSANYDAMQYFLAEIYPLIHQQVPDATLTITGSTQGVDLNGLCLDSSVRLSGYVDDIRPLVAGATVCVVPIREGGGTRLKILEAMALGTPVVATSKGAEGLDAVDGEHLLLADEPAVFAERTLQLLRDPALRQRLAISARCFVEQRYDWAQIGRRFVELVEDVARHRKRNM